MKKASYLVCMLISAMAQAQVTNEVSVYVRPGTQVSVFANMTNTATGDFTMDTQGQLFVQGTLVNNGSMTFNNAASLMRGTTTSDATGSGTYYVRRQGSNNSSVYNYWGSPMVSYSGVPGNNPYLYDSDLSTQDFGDDQPADPGWISHSGAMTPGIGYIGRGAGLHTFTGEVNNGNVDVPLTFYPYAPGNTAPGTPFNLVSNPYPSPVSCASLVSALGNPDIFGSLYFWDDDLSGGTGYASSDYAVWNGTGSLGTGAGLTPPNGFISTGQGFLVRALSGSSVLNFTNTMRAAAPNTQFFKMDAEESRMWFSVEGGELFNQILIGLLLDATEQEDRLYDAVKMRGNTSISLAAQSEEYNYAILAFPPPSYQKTVPLSVFVDEAGLYTFSANTMEGFSDVEVYFTDTWNNTNILLNEGSQIQVSLADGQHDGRFFLNFVPELITSIDEPDPSIVVYSVDNVLNVNARGISDNFVELEIFDTSGRIVIGKQQLALTEGRGSMLLDGLSTGVYVMRVTSETRSLSQKVILK